MGCCCMKGHLSYLILWMLKKEGMKGAGIAAELGRRRGKKPSPGTVYPVLKDLKEKGLIRADKEKAYTLTKKGEKELSSACEAFAGMFYDMDEMVKCCK